jgi:hypothetical protein
MFCTRIRGLKHYQRAKDIGYLQIPVAEDFQNKRYMSHIVPLWSPAADALSIGLLISKITAYPVASPTVPKGQKRVRLVFHAGNTEADVESLLVVIGQWLDERFKGDNLIAGVQTGLADTWEDFGKIKGLVPTEVKAEETSEVMAMEVANLNGNGFEGGLSEKNGVSVVDGSEFTNGLSENNSADGVNGMHQVVVS